jgi:hypothetical protein
VYFIGIILMTFDVDKVDRDGEGLNHFDNATFEVEVGGKAGGWDRSTPEVDRIGGDSTIGKPECVVTGDIFNTKWNLFASGSSGEFGAVRSLVR